MTRLAVAAVDEKTHVYKNGLGTSKPASYERFIYRVTLQRTSVGYVIKVLLPLSVIAAVVFLGFLLPPTRIDVSVGLVVTCLLATIALHLTQSSSMPSVGFAPRISPSGSTESRSWFFHSRTLAQSR